MMREAPTPLESQSEIATRPALRRGVYTIIVLLTVFRVASTHRIFSQTTDESSHIAAGYEWFRGDYSGDPSHPPLARILCALPAYLTGATETTEKEIYRRGNEILWHNGRYVHNLMLARRSNLLWLVAALLGVAGWAKLRFGDATAVVAMLLYSSLPPVLAHAGLATTDMAVAAMFPIALLAFEWWQRRPSVPRSAILGLAVGLGLLSKFSFGVFFGAAMLSTCLIRPWLIRSVLRRSTLVALLVATATVWAGYRFDVGTFSKAHESAPFLVAKLPPPALRPLVSWASAHLIIPAPVFAVGLGWIAEHSAEGQLAYLLGRYSKTGWWYYFPVVMFFKTQLAFLTLSVLGVVWQLRRRSDADLAVLPLGMLLVVMPSTINIGVRHVLPIYAPLAILAAYAAVKLWQEAPHWFSRLTLAAFMSTILIASAAAHPDYLSWFNIAARGHGERIATDSNLDWGQDALRLAAFVKTHKITHFAIILSGSTDLGRLHLPAAELAPFVPVSGWIMVPETGLALHPDARRGGFDWLKAYSPIDHVGTTIRVYFIPQFEKGLDLAGGG